jgi:hypothetical protein
VEVSGRLRKVAEVSENAKIKCFNFVVQLRARHCGLRLSIARASSALHSSCTAVAAEIDTPKEILDTPKEKSITPKVTTVLTIKTKKNYGTRIEFD